MDDALLWLVNNWEKIGVGLLLIFILYGGSRPDPWWVFGREFREERGDKLEWKELALAGTGIAERSTTVAERATKRRKEDYTE